MELFIEATRPRAEMLVIERFLKIYQRGKVYYNACNFEKALDEYENGFRVIMPVLDELPKLVCLYYIMKSKFKLKQYDNCLQTARKLKHEVIDLQLDDEKWLYKIRRKIYLYEIIISMVMYKKMQKVHAKKFLFSLHNNHIDTNYNIIYYKLIYIHNYIHNNLSIEYLNKFIIDNMIELSLDINGNNIVKQFIGNIKKEY